MESDTESFHCPAVIETERLLLRELRPSDAENFFDLNMDLPFQTVGEAQRFLENYDQYLRYGYGRWAVVLKENLEFIGWCGLKFSLELDGTDLGFRFFKKHWGKGFATEAARACIGYGLNHLGLKTIYGRAMKDNKASVRVLEKVGMGLLKEVVFEQHPGLLFSIEKTA
jgi:RimJ/RimL family protein N-acetyltransferase